MNSMRHFLVTQDELVVWLARNASFSESLRFAHSDEGFRRFAAYIRRTPDQASRMVVDVIEEEFVADSAPSLSFRDRNALIERRVSRKFPRSPYRIGLFQGRADHSSEEAEHELLLCSISNEELLEPWLQIIVSNKVPLTGIHSVPLLAPHVLSKLARPAANMLLLTQHHGNRLRQVFLRNGRLKSARLSQSPQIDDDEYGDFLHTEIQRSRRYLERARLMNALDALDVYLVAEQEVADRVLASNPGRIAMQLHCIALRRAAKVFGMAKVPQPDRLEALYLASTHAKRPAYSYALQGETRYSTLRRARSIFIGSATLVAVSCAALASVNLLTASGLRQSSRAIEEQIQRMTETYRRDSDNLRPLRADSHEMKVAVDTGDFILQNRVPVPWVMHQVGAVLGEFPTIAIDELSWQAQSAAQNSSTQNGASRGETMPVAVPATSGVSADLHGEVTPFDGDLRDAFALIDRLAARLQEQTDFDSVVAIEYPLDARPQSALSGVVAYRDSGFRTQFRLRLTMSVPTGENPRGTW